MWPPRSIIVPVALGAEFDGLASTAGALAGALGAELILAGIAPLAPPAPAAQAGDLTPPPLRNDQPFIDELVRERLDELSGRMPERVLVRTVLTWGSVPVALIAAAREEHAELIVVAMRRAGALGHALHDHADRHVLYHSDVPVLVVPVESPPARLD